MAAGPICDRCDKPIKGTPREIPAHAGSGAAPNIVLHPHPCYPSRPRQTAPAGCRW